VAATGGDLTGLHVERKPLAKAPLDRLKVPTPRGIATYVWGTRALLPDSPLEYVEATLGRGKYARGSDPRTTPGT
jgi:hypothetical protein